jgi:hypothetical protein
MPTIVPLNRVELRTSREQVLLISTDFYYFWIGAKSPAPQAIAQDNVRIRVRPMCFVSMKSAAPSRFHAEEIEIIFSDEQAPIALRLLFLLKFQVCADELETDHPRKNVVVIAIVFVIRIGTCVIGTVGHHGFDGNELFGIVDERERVQKHRCEPAVTVALSQMPKASERIATAVKPGFFASILIP